MWPSFCFQFHISTIPSSKSVFTLFRVGKEVLDHGYTSFPYQSYNLGGYESMTTFRSITCYMPIQHNFNGDFNLAAKFVLVACYFHDIIILL